MRSILKASTLESKFPIMAVEHGCIVSKDADITVAFRVTLPGALFGGLGKEQVAGVVQVGTFVEVAFKTAGEKAEFVPADVRLVFLRDENILFVQD